MWVSRSASLAAKVAMLALVGTFAMLLDFQSLSRQLLENYSLQLSHVEKQRTSRLVLSAPNSSTDMNDQERTNTSLYFAGLSLYIHRGDNLDFTKENLGCLNTSHLALCGKRKCFYPLVSTPNQKYGYAVSEYFEKNSHVARRNWELSAYLEDEYGIERLPIDPPTIMEMDREWAEGCLFPKQRKSDEQEPKLPDFGFYEDRPDITRLPLILQKIRAVPPPSVLFKCEDFVLQTLINDHSYWQSVSNLTKYRLTLQHETALAKHILHREDYLLRDFQVLVDRDGRFHYIDIGHLAYQGFDPTAVRNYTSTTEKHITCTNTFDDLYRFVRQQEQLLKSKTITS